MFKTKADKRYRRRQRIAQTVELMDDQYVCTVYRMLLRDELDSMDVINLTVRDRVFAVRLKSVLQTKTA